MTQRIIAVGILCIKNDKIPIAENAKATQHDWYFENSNEVDDEEHLEYLVLLFLL